MLALTVWQGGSVPFTVGTIASCGTVMPQVYRCCCAFLLVHAACGPWVLLAVSGTSLQLLSADDSEDEESSEDEGPSRAAGGGRRSSTEGRRSKKVVHCCQTCTSAAAATDVVLRKRHSRGGTGNQLYLKAHLPLHLWRVCRKCMGWQLAKAALELGSKPLHHSGLGQVATTAASSMAPTPRTLMATIWSCIQAEHAHEASIEDTASCPLVLTLCAGR